MGVSGRNRGMDELPAILAPYSVRLPLTVPTSCCNVTPAVIGAAFADGFQTADPPSIRYDPLSIVFLAVTERLFHFEF